MKSSKQKEVTGVQPPVVRPVKLTKGARVRVTRGGYVIGIGRYYRKTARKNGTWLIVNMAAPGDKPEYRMYRQSNLTLLS